MKGRPQSVNYSPKEFQELSREERVLRGRISTLKKMIQRREDKIDELMKPVLKKKSEVNSPIGVYLSSVIVFVNLFKK